MIAQPDVPSGLTPQEYLYHFLKSLPDIQHREEGDHKGSPLQTSMAQFLKNGIRLGGPAGISLRGGFPVDDGGTLPVR
jgi:hypothetical protein